MPEAEPNLTWQLTSNVFGQHVLLGGLPEQALGFCKVPLLNDGRRQAREKGVFQL